MHLFHIDSRLNQINSTVAHHCHVPRHWSRHHRSILGITHNIWRLSSSKIGLRAVTISGTHPKTRKKGPAKAEDISHYSWAYSSTDIRNCSSKKFQLEKKGYFPLPDWQAGRRCTVSGFKKAEEVRWHARTFMLEQAENLFGERRIMGSLSSSLWKGLSPHLWFSQGTLLYFIPRWMKEHIYPAKTVILKNSRPIGFERKH